MVGALVKCALGKMHVEDITVRLKSGEQALPVLPRPPKDYFSSACATDSFEPEKTATDGVRQVATCNASDREENKPAAAGDCQFAKD